LAKNLSSEIDLVVLNRASIELQYNAVAFGIRFYERDKEKRVKRESYVLSRHGDYLPLLRRQREEIIEGVSAKPEFSGIEKRLERLKESLHKLEALRVQKRY